MGITYGTASIHEQSKAAERLCTLGGALVGMIVAFPHLQPVVAYEYLCQHDMSGTMVHTDRCKDIL